MSWFEAQAPLLPEIVALHGKWLADKPAVVDGVRTLSWREFDRRTNQVAPGCSKSGCAGANGSWC